MAFKDNFRIEKIYFQRVKDDAQILGSWKNDPRRYSREEIIRVAKDACDSILMLYRLIGESWNDALNQIEKLSAELDALAAKTDAYHDELNEKIDEVNNYLNTQIKDIEAQIDAFGGLPSNANANEGDVLTVGENHVNEWKTLAPIYIDANYNSDEYRVILTLNNEPITNTEIFALLDAGKDVKIILNSFDTGVHNELPVILNYVKTFNETVIEEDEEEQEIEADVETRFFQACVMPDFSISNDGKDVSYLNAYNLGISTVSHQGVLLYDVVNVVPYTFKGIEIDLFSPVNTPEQQDNVELEVRNAPQMHEFYDNFVLGDSHWFKNINASLSYFDDATLPVKYLKANLSGISIPDFDTVSNTYKSQLLFSEIQATNTAPFYNIRTWRVIWEYDPENKTDTFYIPGGLG